ncbi:MAG TPA: hypothetical protein VFS50_13845 [Meiothermus sp.]|jgi:hypothetical protein|nr:hypothetical protein [Meiothermus sp.]
MNQTIQAFRADILARPRKHLIDYWEGVLREKEDPLLQAIAADLRALREELEQPRLDPAQIGQILLALGSATSRTARRAEDPRYTGPLEVLAELLSEARNRLAPPQALPR